MISFEFGLLWPEFTGRFGEVFGVCCSRPRGSSFVSDARRAGTPDLERYFRVRALAAALATGALAAAGLVLLHSDPRFVFDGLTSAGLPIQSLVCGVAALVLLRRGAVRGPRPLAVGAVGAVIWGWGVAQHPYLLSRRHSRSTPLRRRAPR